MGVDGMKERYMELLKNEPLLKQHYLKQGGRTLVPEGEQNKEPAKDQDK